MQLREFVKATILDVLNGIEEARKDEKVGGKVAPGLIGGHEFATGHRIASGNRHYSTIIGFDVAVTAETADAAKGEAGIKIAVLKLGVDGATSTKNTTVNRITFDVPVLLA